MNVKSDWVPRLFVKNSGSSSSFLSSNSMVKCSWTFLSHLESASSSKYFLVALMYYKVNTHPTSYSSSLRNYLFLKVAVFTFDLNTKCLVMEKFHSVMLALGKGRLIFCKLVFYQNILTMIWYYDVNDGSIKEQNAKREHSLLGDLLKCTNIHVCRFSQEVSSS